MPEAKPAERKPRGLVLVRPGKYIQQAATMRMKQLEKDLAESSKAKAAEPVVPVAVSIVKSGAPIPAVEWWDQKLLVDPAAGYDSKPNLERVTSYIYHPVAVASLTAAPAPPPMPVLLTKKERKKIKKRNKREELKEKQDRVRLGLEAPAEPKSQSKTRIARIGRLLCGCPLPASCHLLISFFFFLCLCTSFFVCVLLFLSQCAFRI